MTKVLTLTGDENVPAMPMTDAQVNHLRRLLAWMACEYMLDGDMQRGFILAATQCAKAGIASPQRLDEVLQQKVEQINRVPAYVRQAHKMLTKALRDHEKRSGIVEFDGDA